MTGGAPGVAAIQEQSIDCANTVRRIQLFSRSIPHSQLGGLDLNETVRDVLNQTQPMWKDDTREAGIEVLVSTNLRDVAPVTGFLSGS